MSTAFAVYILAYIITIIYFVVLGCVMLTRRADLLSTRGEQAAKQRMHRTVGVTMLVLALEYFVSLPPFLLGWPVNHPCYRVIFLANLMLFMLMCYHVMFAVVQRRTHLLRWTCGLSLPFVLLAAYQTLSLENLIPVYIGIALGLTAFIFLPILFIGEYRRYVRRLRSEYSDTTSRDILWSWIVFFGLSAQGLLYIVYVTLWWEPVWEVVYITISMLNAAALCYCTCRQRTLDQDVVRENVDENENVNQNENRNADEEKAFYIDIEQKLHTLCEAKMLYLDPDITLETLSLRLAINRTYLSMYFRSRNMSYYQYINTLRVEHAIRLMQDEPHLSIRKVSEQSGFRSQTTFRKVFQEVMGCLPSEVKNN